MSTLRFHNLDRGGYWIIPRDEFNAARRQFQWLCFAPMTEEQVALLEAWAESRPNVVWGDAKSAEKAETMREMLRDVQIEASGGTYRGGSPFKGTAGFPALDRLVDAISHSDAVFYLAARGTPVSF